MGPDQPARRPEDGLADRDLAAESDDQYAHARDVAADDDDQEAAARDRAAAGRDADAENRDAEAEAYLAPSNRQKAAEDRRHAAEDRDRARGDRGTSYQQRRRAGADRWAAHDAVAELRGLLFIAEDDAEAMAVVGQAQGMIMTARGSDPLQALIELASRAARDSCQLPDAARSIIREVAE
jgi:hypothetical protein